MGRPTVRTWAGAAALAVSLTTALPATAETAPPDPTAPTPTATATPGTTTPSTETSVGGRSTVGGPRMAETGVVVAPGAPALPSVMAPAWVVADADTGQVLAARDPHRLLRPASTQKTLLALTMAPRLDPNGTYTADSEDANQEGTRIGLWPGFTYRIQDLWYSLFLKSGNDAATGLAKAGAGTVANAVAMEQAEARRLQANDTTVVNPSGLDADGQFSSAYDLALWGRAALQRGDLRRYMGSLRHDFEAIAVPAVTPYTNEHRYMLNENRLLRNGFPGIIGVKTGYTTKAQNTFIAADQRDGHTILVTLMSDPKGGVISDSEGLINWGLANTGTVQPVGALVDPLTPAVVTDLDNAPAVDRVAESRAAAGHDLAPSASRWMVWTAPPVGLVALAALGLLLRRGRRRVPGRVRA
jgi:D-alanyl-D-alanine carboxypeptidase (penicillin-binding protein 5/6)